MRPCHLALPLLLMLGCGGGGETATDAIAPADAAPASEPTQALRLMTMQLRPSFDDYMLPLIAEFEAAHPGTHIEWLDFPSDGYFNRLQMDFFGGDPPDVINLSYDFGLPMAQQGVLADMRDLVSPEVIASYFPGVLESACTWDGAIFALPWYLSTGVTLYNRDLFERAGLDPDHPPRTWEEVWDVCRAIHERLPGHFGFFETLTEAGQLRDFLARENVPLIERQPDGSLRAGFATPAGAAALQVWVDAFQQGLIPRECLIPDHRRSIELYKAGTTAMFFTGPQFLEQICADAPDICAVTDAAPIPMGSIGVTKVDVMSVGVPDRGDSPEAQARERLAAEFAAFMTNGPNQLAFCRRVTILPSVITAAHDPLFTDDGGTLAGRARVIAAQELETARVYIPPLPEPTRLHAALNRAVEQACLGEATAADALAEAAATWDAVFAEPSQEN